MEDLDLLRGTNKVFDIIAVSENRITKQTSLTNIKLRNYATEFTVYLSYKPCPDLNIYEANQSESIFDEIINPKKSNIVIGCIYKHPNIDVLDFKNNYLSQTFKIVSKE